MIEKDNSFVGKTRDKVAWAIAQFALNRIATPWYRGMIDGSIRLGLAKAVEDVERSGK